MKSYGSDYAQCYIRKNRSNVGEAYTNPDSNSDSGWYSSSNSVVIHLVHGDQVNLDSCSPIASIYGFIHTTFSGFLLRAD